MNLLITFFFRMPLNLSPLGEDANFATDYFLLNYKFLAKNKREFTTKFAILPNGFYEIAPFYFSVNSVTICLMGKCFAS
jgi:hypothetical protein